MGGIGCSDFAKLCRLEMKVCGGSKMVQDGWSGYCNGS